MAIDREKVLQAAQKYVEKKKYDKAVLEYRRLIEADPNDARTLLKIGDLQAKQGLHGEAISTYETVGKLYAQQGFALKAIAVYKQIREIIAKHVPQLEERFGHIAPKLAELYQQLGLTSDALAALDEVASRLQRQQRDPEAIEVFRKIVELDPTNPLPHLRLAEALSRVKDVEGAVFEFKTAAAQLAGIGRRDDAIKVLERLLHHKQDAEQARICAELYLSRGQQQDGMQALSKLQICFQANPRDFDTLSLLARAFTAIGQGAKAIEVQKEMGRVARDAGKQDLFREIVERLVRVAPNDEGVRKLSAQLASSGSVPPYGSVAPSSIPVSEAAPSVPHAPPHARSAAISAPTQTAGARPAPPPAPIGRPAPPPPPPSPRAAALVDEYADDDVELEAYEEVDDDASFEDETEAHESAHHPESVGQYAESVDYDSSAGYVEERGYADDEPSLDEQIQKVLADANAFRRVRLYNKAIGVLQGGLELDPRSMDLHEVYRDVLIEAGQIEEAVQEMLAIAGLFIDALDGESAARALQDVLAFDPENVRAVEILQELGYEVVDENEDAGAPENSNYGHSGDHAPLPSYDLEEMRVADVSAEYEDGRHIVRSVTGDALPSFPLDEQDATHGGRRNIGDLDEPDAHAQVDDDGYAVSYAEVESSEEDAYGELQSVSEPPASLGAATHDLEDALDEAEFFCSRGLFDDALAILTEQRHRHPNHPLLRERIAEIEAQAQAQQRESGAREKPREEDDRAYDIAASLDAIETLNYDSVQPAEGFANEEQQIDVEEVFAKFKEGVAKQISVDDSDSHYDLGIAYKEMMLVDDAIREFDVAARDPKHECVCRSMIGSIEFERGHLAEAIDAFLLALAAPVKEPPQETAISYELGAAYEANKMPKDALNYFQRAMRRDPNYRDVQERVRRLQTADSRPQPRQLAVGADDEFDRAFDDLLSDKKKN